MNDGAILLQTVGLQVTEVLALHYLMCIHLLSLYKINTLHLKNMDLMLLIEEAWKFCQNLISLSSTGPEASHRRSHWGGRQLPVCIVHGVWVLSLYSLLTSS